MANAVIFDMNGVIVDDERIHQESWRVFCKNHGFDLTEDQFKHDVFGRRETDTFANLFKRELEPKELQGYLDERVTIAMDLFRPQLAAVEGVIDLLKDLHAKKIPLAVATSARKPYTSFILDGLDIRQYFNSVITAEDVTHGKPDPEVFLKSAEALGITPEACVVIEDTLSGIKAAQAANMEVIGITTTHTEEEIGIANKVIKNFGEITPEDIERMGETRSSEGERRL